MAYQSKSPLGIRLIRKERFPGVATAMNKSICLYTCAVYSGTADSLHFTDNGTIYTQRKIRTDVRVFVSGLTRPGILASLRKLEASASRRLPTRGCSNTCPPIQLIYYIYWGQIPGGRYIATKHLRQIYVQLADLYASYFSRGVLRSSPV